MLAVCTGDWQVGAHGRRDDQEQVIGRIVDLAIERNADLFLHGGDVFHGPTVYPEDLGVVRRALARLRVAGIPVLIASGNGAHDQAMRGENALAVFSEYPGVTVASTPEVHTFDGCTVAALPWVSPARLQARYGSAASRDEVNAHVAELLVSVARDLLEDCRRVGTDLPAVLLTHFAISGASLPTGLPVDLMSEPVLALAELEELGFDAVVASHIHKPQLLTSELGGGPVFFTGSPMAHDFGEAGFEHGVWLLEFVDGGTRVSFEPIESRSLITLDYADVAMLAADLATMERLDDVASIDGALVRVRFPVTREELRHLDIPAARRTLTEAGAHSVKVEPQIIRADRARVAGLDDSMSELDALDEWSRVNGVEELLAGLMREKTRDYMAALA